MLNPDKATLARQLRSLDLLTCPNASLIAWLVALDQPSRGTREELIERLHRMIWQAQYD